MDRDPDDTVSLDWVVDKELRDVIDFDFTGKYFSMFAEPPIGNYTMNVTLSD